MTAEKILAEAFAKSLQAVLAGDVLREIDRRNSLPEYAGCCASHDFCDANDVMDAAFVSAFGREFMPDCDAENITQADLDLWNAAWDLAKESGFAA